MIRFACVERKNGEKKRRLVIKQKTYHVRLSSCWQSNHDNNNTIPICSFCGIGRWCIELRHGFLISNSFVTSLPRCRFSVFSVSSLGKNVLPLPYPLFSFLDLVEICVGWI